jgi:sec-independent protein translocase protein TatA
MNLAFIQGIGPTELIIVLVIVLLIFGPKRLPSLARSMGTGMREFKDSVSGKSVVEDDDARPQRAVAGPALGRPEEPATTTPAKPAGAVAAESHPVDGEHVPERR